jgi:hypothetical protein
MSYPHTENPLVDENDIDDIIGNPLTGFPEVGFPEVGFPQHSNTYNSNINLLTKLNQSYIVENNKTDSDRLIDFDGDECVSVKSEILQRRGIPYTYNRDIDKAEQAIHFLNDWDIFYPNGFGNDTFSQAAYNMFNIALIEMITSQKDMTFKGFGTNYAKIIELINEKIEFNDDAYTPYATLDTVRETVLSDYTDAVKTRQITDHLQYMKSCIYSVLKTGDVNIKALLLRDFGKV